MLCPLCGQRKARRHCPALNQLICAVCCGTKRMVEIRCPSDCAYLAASREHPPAAFLRQRQHDAASLAGAMRDFNERQSRLFFLIVKFLMDYEPPELQPLIDADVVEAAGALAATFETAARGVIYEHRPPSISANRLVTALQPLLAEAGKGGGTAFERDGAVVLRRVESAARERGASDHRNRRAFLDLLERMIPRGSNAARQEGPAEETARIVLP